MSQYLIRGIDPNNEVCLGWDRRMQTFFAQVIPPGEVDPYGAGLLLWVGVRAYEIPTVEGLAKAIGRFAIITPELATQLTEDQRAERAW